MSKSAIKLLLTLKCEESTRLVSESLDRDLSPAQRWAVRLHALVCRPCRRYGKQLHLLRDAVRRMAAGKAEPTSPVTLGPDARSRIAQALEFATDEEPR
ncbi:MAG: zf-HC2 domain-containing protein [Phycisphaerae bacterium]|jgi:hypothetical protein